MTPFPLIKMDRNGVTPLPSKITERNKVIPLPVFESRENGMISDRKAQSAVIGLIFVLVLITIASGLVDIYRLYAARNWAYQVAQEAALAGASRGRDWNSITAGDEMRLNADIAISEAQEIVQVEMDSRQIVGYSMDIRVLPEPNGGTISGFPPRSVRLGTSRGDWNSDEPAVGIYLTMPVSWLMLDRLGIVGKSVSVFAAAGVAQ